MVFGLKIFGMMYGMGCFGVDIDLCALQNRVGCNRGVQLFLECWLLGSLRTFCNFFLKITLKFSVLMLKSQLNTYFYKSE